MKEIIKRIKIKRLLDTEGKKYLYGYMKILSVEKDKYPNRVLYFDTDGVCIFQYRFDTKKLYTYEPFFKTICGAYNVDDKYLIRPTVHVDLRCVFGILGYTITEKEGIWYFNYKQTIDNIHLF